MRISVLSSMVFWLLAAVAMPAFATDFSGDIAKLREFLDLDKSYSPSERAEAEAAFAKLKARAADMSPAAFQLAVAHIAALTRNGHTMLVAGVWANQFNRTPLRYHVFADGTRVVHAPDSMRELLGARVVAIDGHGIEEIRTAFGQYFGAREGQRDEWVGFFLELPAILNAAGFAKAEDRVEAQLELANGSTVTRTLSGALDPPEGELLAFLDDCRLVTFAAENVMPPAAVPLYLSRPGQAFRLEPLPEVDAYFMQFRINKSYYEQKIDPFLASVRATLQKAKPKNVIVDLRLDGGGDLNTTRSFLQDLPSLTAKDGRIFVLTSGRTFSAGIASAGYLKQAAPSRVTIVGEPIGDHLEFWAEGDFMQLPVSKAALLAATERHNYMTGCSEADCHSSIRKHPIRVQSLEPDIAAPLTYSDYRAGHDPAIEAVRKALGR
jgi:hypothetical protein